jgi:serine O-acetyltransferase
MSLSSLKLYRVGNRLHSWHLKPLSQAVYLLDRLVGAKSIPPSATIGAGTRLAYGGKGVVVHARAQIGTNCLISPGVVIGGRAGENQVPVIGNNVILRPGCMILGPVTIGANAEIGPNAVVIQDIPEGGVYVAPLGRLL